MKTWPDIERLVLNRLTRECGPLSPCQKKWALKELRAMFEAWEPPNEQRLRVMDAERRARYGRHADSNWFGVAQQILGTELIIKEMPDRAKFYEGAAGKMLLRAASKGKLREIEDLMKALESTEVHNLLHLKIVGTYVRATHEDGSPPTLQELQAEFLRHNSEALLPKGFSFRKMVVETLKLPLSPSKRGRPEIRNRKS
jgi:hypothetical protein